jgi:F-type H+-transporting ATPase subunit b
MSRLLTLVSPLASRAYRGVARSGAVLCAGLPVVALAATLPGLAFAAEEGHGNPWLDLLWKGINLLVLVGLIAYFARKPVSAAMRAMAKEGHDRWSGAHKAAQDAKTEMQAQRRQIEELAGELQRMVASARVDAERERARLTGEAQQQAERILAHAREQVEQEMAKARTELRKQLAEETLRLAEQMIREQATPEQRRSLMDGYIREMEARR